MRIQVDLFDENSVKQAVKQINKYKKWVKQKEHELLEGLADIGVVRAQILFDQIVAISNGDTIHADVEDVVVTKDVVGNRLIITAKGEDVAFIEFGAGVRYGTGYRGNRPEGIDDIGEYGKGKGKNPKGWWYSTGEVDRDGKKVSKHSYGNPPAMGMYYAEQTIIEKVTEVAREVFKS
jgi:hypothetical protein